MTLPETHSSFPFSEASKARLAATIASIGYYTVYASYADESWFVSTTRGVDE